MTGLALGWGGVTVSPELYSTGREGLYGAEPMGSLTVRHPKLFGDYTFSEIYLLSCNLSGKILCGFQFCTKFQNSLLV